MGYRGHEEGSGDLSAECRGWELRDREGERIGKVEEVFVDEDDRPEYLGVKTGLLSGKLNLIPAALVRADNGRRSISVAESRDRIKDAPSLGSNEEITAERERGIREHFGLETGAPSDGDREGDTSEISPGYRQDSGGEPWRGEESAGPEPRPTSAEPSEGSAGAEAATGDGDRDHGAPPETPGNQETMRVSVWREKARAEKVIGDDGGEEVRIRKQWVEEEEVVEVEDNRRR